MHGASPAFVPNESGLSCLPCTSLRPLAPAVFVYTGIRPTAQALTNMCQQELLRVCTNGRPSRKQSAEISYWRRNDDMRRRVGTAHAGSKKACRVTGASKPAPRHPSSPQRLCSAAGPRHQPQSIYKEADAPKEESVAVGGRNICGSAMPLCLDMARNHDMEI